MARIGRYGHTLDHVADRALSRLRSSVWSPDRSLLVRTRPFVQHLESMPRDPFWLRPLEEMLRIEAIDADRFHAVLPGFGGVTLGCATLAAARTCADRALHSLHAFLPFGAVSVL